MRRRGAAAVLIVLLSVLRAGSAAGAEAGLVEALAPPFLVRAAEPLRHQAGKVAADAPSLAAFVAARLGLPPPPSGTIVVTASARPGEPPDDLAEGVPSWAAGVTLPGSETILLRVDRIGGYGQRELRQVLAHELAHLTMAAALPRRGLELPPWFREGIASAVSAETELLDKWFLWTSSLAASPHPFADLDAALASGEPSHAVAYAGSLAAVNFLLREHGAGFPARLFSGLRMGAGFEAAFAAAAGASIGDAETAWRADLRRPRRWIMWIGSAFTLWVGVSILILLAFAVKRHRSRRTLDRWRVEEGPDLIDRIAEDAAARERGSAPPGRDAARGPGDDDETVH